MGRITQFAANGVGNAFGGLIGQALREPQRAYNFSLEISFDQPQKDEKVLSLSSAKRFLDTQMIDLAIDSAFLPTVQFEIVGAKDINKHVQYAGNITTSGGKLVLNDFIIQPIMSTIDNWVRQVYDYETDEPGLPENYKKTASINLTGSMALPERVWDITGLWPSKVDYGTLDMNSSDRVKISLELSYDSAVYVGSTELKFLKNAIGV